MIGVEADMQPFERRRRERVSATLTTLKSAVTDAARTVRGALNEDVERSLKTSRVFLPWTADVFPAGARLAWEPSALVRSRAPYITNPQTDGAMQIGGASGVLIPVPNSPAAQIRRGRGGRSRIDIIKQRYGALYEAVPLGRGQGVLLLWPAVAGVRRRKGQPQREGFFPAWKNERIKNQATGFRVMREGAQLIPMFIWKPQVTLAPKLKTRSIMEQAARSFPDDVAARLSAAFKRAEAAA